MRIQKVLLLCTFIISTTASSVWAADYIIDSKGAHASIDFRFKHLNISWLSGEFKDFDGTFSYDAAKPEASSVEVEIRVASIDSNHAERDKHMRSDKYLDTDKYPNAKFVSSKIETTSDGKLMVYGDFTFHGVTKQIVIASSAVGAGNDPWGGYRAGFEGTVTINTQDFGATLPPSNEVELTLYLEGIRK